MQKIWPWPRSSEQKPEPDVQSEHPPEPQSVIQEGQPVTLPVQCPSWVFLQSPDPEVQLVHEPGGAEQSVSPPKKMLHSLFRGAMHILLPESNKEQEPDP